MYSMSCDDHKEYTPITIDVSINEMIISIVCGDGNQNMKWLSITASQRYVKRQSNINIENFRLLSSKMLKKEAPTNFFLPKCTRDFLSRELIHPSAIIKVAYPNGGKVIVEIQDKVELSPLINEPIYTLWQLIAFGQSEEFLQLIPNTSEFPSSERKMIREYESYTYKPDYLINDIDAAEELQKDFSRIHLDDILSQNNINDIKKYIFPNFELINKLFSFYSFPKKTMTLSNYYAVTFRCLEWDRTILQSRMEKYYFFTNYELYRYEFIESLIRFTLLDFPNSSLDCIQRELLRKLLINTTNLFETPPMRFYDNPGNASIINQKINRLKYLFNKYSDSPEAISINSLSQLIDKENINKRQLNLLSNFENIYDRGILSNGISLQYLVFPEFLESVLLTIYENLDETDKLRSNESIGKQILSL